ncbi:MAG: 5'/3'-nucleotidase SurE [Candidatus Neomarinimicrobiota bacterium]|nr:5'/3'-nucleotidase SurE [Candidatus Neomarinimicrobiota bacterium]MDD3965721.1 5'/3'-nucleotidase SurE [Candidatus Neomarinimicrobiota bacterium]MDX9779579.1 5'/3'-nucleotidase SurE [bacterium]
MNILLVNDDGIAAPGIAALYSALCDFAAVHVIAPDGERSAVSHGITLDKPISVRKYLRDGLFEGIAVSGSPADCVKLALNELLDRRPDLVLSGINLGCNSGLNVIYSGTVGGAAEAVFNGIPGIAISLTTYQDPNWEPAQAFARKLVQRIAERGIPAGVLLNVNVPNVRESAEIAGIRITEQGMAQWQEAFYKRTDPKGRTYYWMSGSKKETPGNETIDDTAIKNNYISVTPLQFNLTAYAEMKKIQMLELEY